MRAAGFSDIGKLRQSNEDALAILADKGLYIVADGMGGHNAGAIASKLVVDVLPQIIEQRLTDTTTQDVEGMTTLFRNAIVDLSQRIWRESCSSPGLTGMGATVVLAFFQNDRVFIAHMGDSRAYLFKDNKLTQLTQDHSVVGILLRQGVITPREATRHPAKGRLSRYVGMETLVYPDVQAVRTEVGDRLLLCTDGLTSMVDDAVIGEILSTCPAPDESCHTLVNAANAAGGRDNITVVVVEQTADDSNEGNNTRRA